MNVANVYAMAGRSCLDSRAIRSRANIPPIRIALLSLPNWLIALVNLSVIWPRG